MYTFPLILNMDYAFLFNTCLAVLIFLQVLIFFISIIKIIIAFIAGYRDLNTALSVIGATYINIPLFWLVIAINCLASADFCQHMMPFVISVFAYIIIAVFIDWGVLYLYLRRDCLKLAGIAIIMNTTSGLFLILLSTCRIGLW